MTTRVRSSIYVFNFEEVEEAYWFGPVRVCVRGSHFAYGQEQLEIGFFFDFFFRRTFRCRVMPLF